MMMKKLFHMKCLGNMPSLRHKIITGEYTKKDALIQINAVLDFMFNNFYADKKPKTTNNYILEKHIDRVGVRLIELYRTVNSSAQ